ncbi:hypothetical protein CXB51_008309 [Gossypium anomalum]|uniref:Uncharacterized protein n=1 Tax=Gossypium anomalum TaxID=47600 RepID=A0A8J5ZD61_9ROSI|nr:hypothetical protein CXB51_008309 [Gossypium anomalum]
MEMGVCQIYDAPYYYRDYLYKTNFKEFRNIDTEEVLRFLMLGKEMWTYQIGTGILEMFSQKLMTPKSQDVDEIRMFKNMAYSRDVQD